jgi:hypothetical protein
MNVRQMLSNMGMLSTGGHFKNQYKGDVIRKRRDRNDKKKNSARTRQLDNYSDSMDEPIKIEESVPIVLEHYLKQLHAACVALPLLKSMWETPEVFLAVLHDIAVNTAVYDQSDDEQQTESEHSESEHSESEHSESEHSESEHSESEHSESEHSESKNSESKNSESWASVLSSASVLQGSPYTNLVNQLFMTPFKSHDAFQIQQSMADKLSHDMRNIKEYVLPYAKDSEHHILNSVSTEVDQVERFLESNTEHTSRFYDWKQVLVRLERVTQDAIHSNSVAEFKYNDKMLKEGVLENLSGEAEDLGSYPDDELLTPKNAVGILEWRCSDLNYEEILSRASPEDTLRSQHSVDELFSDGINYNLTLPIFECKANVRTLNPAMTPTMGELFVSPSMVWGCYDILHSNDFSKEADEYLAEFKNVLMSKLPNVRKIGVCSLGEVHGLKVIKLSLEFVGLGEVQDLYTYMTIPLRHAANSREPIRVVDVNLLSVLKQGAGMVRMMDDTFLVEEVLDAIQNQGV